MCFCIGSRLEIELRFSDRSHLWAIKFWRRVSNSVDKKKKLEEVDESIWLVKQMILVLKESNQP